MAVGDTRTIEGVEYEVIWAGGEGLIPDRQTKVTDAWTGPKRIYNRTGKHTRTQEIPCAVPVDIHVESDQTTESGDSVNG